LLPEVHFGDARSEVRGVFRLFALVAGRDEDALETCTKFCESARFYFFGHKGLLTLSTLSLAGIPLAGLAEADVHDLRPGQWAGGVGAGFLTNTPDGVEFALKGHVDYALIRGLAVGLLGQATLGGNDHGFGLSAQAEYWWDFPGTRPMVTVVV
jgi:hypothetical protein